MKIDHDFRILTLKALGGGGVVGTHRALYIFQSHSLTIIDMRPTCFVPVSQHVMVIFILKQLLVAAWVHYDN